MKSVSTIANRFSYFIHPHKAKRFYLIGRTIVQDLVRCDLLRQASAMAYVTLLSLVPSLVAVFCVISLFSPLVAGHDSFIVKIRQFILANLATGSGESVVRYLDHMLKDIDLAKIGWSSFASVLVTLILLLRQVEEALNKIWLIRRSRNLFTRFMYFWSFLTLGLLVLGIGLGASSGFNIQRLLQWGQVSPSNTYFSLLWSMGSATLFFFALYKVVPNCKVNSWSAIAGSLVAAFLLQQAGRLYGLYVKDAKNYQTLYGALAQLPLFLTWLYICWVVILLGALISWRLQEGFPQSEDEGSYIAKTSLELWRDAQVRGGLPLIALLAIYKNFESGNGRGVKSHELAHRLELPTIWIAEAMDVLVALGYVIATQDLSQGVVLGEEEHFFPRLAAERLSLSKIREDFSKPLRECLGHWQHCWPVNLGAVLEEIFFREDKAGSPHEGRLSSVLQIMSSLG